LDDLAVDQFQPFVFVDDPGFDHLTVFDGRKTAMSELDSHLVGLGPILTCWWPLAGEVAAEEAIFGAAVGVVVVGDIAHVVVDVDAAKVGRGYFAEAGVHVGELSRWRLGAVAAPDDHRRLADLALRDPADVVLVVPRRDPRGRTQLAPRDARF
jgi:hypothetical protein